MAIRFLDADETGVIVEREDGTRFRAPRDIFGDDLPPLEGMPTLSPKPIEPIATGPAPEEAQAVQNIQEEEVAAPAPAPEDDLGLEFDGTVQAPGVGPGQSQAPELGTPAEGGLEDQGLPGIEPEVQASRERADLLRDMEKNVALADIEIQQSRDQTANLEALLPTLTKPKEKAEVLERLQFEAQKRIELVKGKADVQKALLVNETAQKQEDSTDEGLLAMRETIEENDRQKKDIAVKQAEFEKESALGIRSFYENEGGLKTFAAMILAAAQGFLDPRSNNKVIATFEQIAAEDVRRQEGMLARKEKGLDRKRTLLDDWFEQTKDNIAAKQLAEATLLKDGFDRKLAEINLEMLPEVQRANLEKLQADVYTKVDEKANAAINGLLNRRAKIANIERTRAKGAGGGKPTALEERKLALGERRADIAEIAQERLAAKEERKAVAEKGVPNLIVGGRPLVLDRATTAEATKARKTFDARGRAYSLLGDLMEDRRKFKTMDLFLKSLSEEASVARAKHSELIEILKDAAGFGANFTKIEKDLLNMQVGDRPGQIRFIMKAWDEMRNSQINRSARKLDGLSSQKVTRELVKAHFEEEAALDVSIRGGGKSSTLTHQPGGGSGRDVKFSKGVGSGPPNTASQLLTIGSPVGESRFDRAKVEKSQAEKKKKAAAEKKKAAAKRRSAIPVTTEEPTQDEIDAAIRKFEEEKRR